MKQQINIYYDFNPEKCNDTVELMKIEMTGSNKSIDVDHSKDKASTSRSNNNDVSLAKQ